MSITSKTNTQDDTSNALTQSTDPSSGAAANSAIAVEPLAENSEDTTLESKSSNIDTEKECENNSAHTLLHSPPSTSTLQQKHWLIYLSYYINLNVEVIKDRVLEKLDKGAANTTLIKAKNNQEMSSIILLLSNFISTFIPLITSTTIDAYNRENRLKLAEEAAKASWIKHEIETTSNIVAEALSKEAYMPCKRMKDFIGKEISKNVQRKNMKQKNFRVGKKVTFATGRSSSNNKSNKCTKNPNSSSSPKPTNMKRRRSPSQQTPIKKKKFLKNKRDLSGNTKGKKGKGKNNFVKKQTPPTVTNGNQEE